MESNVIILSYHVFFPFSFYLQIVKKKSSILVTNNF